MISDDDPTKESVNGLCVFVEKLILQNSEGIFDFENFRISLKKGFDYDLDIDSSLTEDPLPSLKFDVIISTISKLNQSDIVEKICSEKDYGSLISQSGTKNGIVLFKNMKGVGFKSKMIPDRIKSVESNLRTAKKQFSNTRSGIIFVELNFLTAYAFLTDSLMLEKTISSILDNNTRVSAIVITVEGFPEDEKKIAHYQKAFEFRNDNPKYPLPDNFEIII